MEDPKRMAEVHYTTEGPVPIVELVVPHGTRLLDLVKAQETISRELLPGLTARGCQTCVSGSSLTIRERFENVIQINLENGQLIR